MQKKMITMEGFLNEIELIHKGAYQRKFCFVLGAGASKPSGIPMGTELVDRWEKSLAERNLDEHLLWKEHLGITNENKYQYYSEYYERQFVEPEDGYNYLKHEMANAMPSAGYVVLAHILCKTPHQVVITTNFDHLVEKAVNEYAHTMPLVIGHEALAHHVPSQINSPVVLKIHNDLLLRPKSVTRDLKRLSSEWRTTLERIFREYHPVFIGYAGNDPSLMNFLLDNADFFRNRKWRYPYWMIYGKNQPTDKVERFINESDGFWINHEGFDETLYQIGRRMKYDEPSEAIFLNEARKRFQALQDTFCRLKTKYDSSDQKIESKSSHAIFLSTLDSLMQQTDDMRKYREAKRLSYEKKHEEALAIMRQLVETHQENAFFHNGLGDVLHDMKKDNEALKAYQEAVKIQPDNTTYLNNLCVVLCELKRYEEALVPAQRAVELESNIACYYNNLSAALHGMESYEEAQEAAQKAIELDPDDADYFCGLGITLAALERYNEALEVVQQAQALAPHSAYPYYAFGIVLRGLKNYPEALDAARKAVEINPDDAHYLWRLAQILHDMKQDKEALPAAQKAAELDPLDKRIQETLKAIQDALNNR